MENNYKLRNLTLRLLYSYSTPDVNTAPTTSFQHFADKMQTYISMSCECQTPLLTAKSFFLSVGICTGAVLLFYALRIALFKLLGPKRSYLWKFDNLILDMKEVIRIGETIEGLYDDHRRDGYTTRQHITFCLRHIDKIPTSGRWPTAREALGDLAYFQPVLVDVPCGYKWKTETVAEVVASSESSTEDLKDLSK
jgi:hypothetical protein